MNFRERLKRSFKHRFAILYPFGLYMLIFAVPDRQSMRQGIGLIVAGLLLRLWANGYAIKMDKLTTCGPYAFVRHPLYLGTILLAAGAVIMLKVYYLGILLFLVMGFVYYRTMKTEDKMLQDKFAGQYLDYKRRVPAILPTIFPFRAGEKWPFSLERLIRSQEYKLTIWITVLVIVFYLKARLIGEGRGMDVGTWLLLVLAVALGLIDIGSELAKSVRKRKIS
jgi:protein-S-isoprenylcysteine O-methyltransferase Ste14